MAIITPIQILQTFIEDLSALVTLVLTDAGVEDSSNLIKTLKWETTSDGVQLVAQDYFFFLSTGRKPNARKVPIEALLSWMKKKGIDAGNRNQVAWAIQQGIYKNGIQGKNYLRTTIDELKEYTAVELLKVLSKNIASEITKSFTEVGKS